MTASAAAPLRLLALDADDLEVLSAALQDAVTRIGDIRWERDAGRLTIALNRLCWEADAAPEARVRAAVQFGFVRKVRSRNLRQAAPDAVLQLLAIRFDPGVAPGGAVTLAFADGGDLEIEVECVDAALADISEPWGPARRPAHASDGAEPPADDPQNPDLSAS
ncbi:MAG: DUF2948 family protein [Alphaproteobacteria bacterium]|nr:DUF2948 family protein [Alphaproteobacteria bacterium]